jgi:hypothetical protein
VSETATTVSEFSDSVFRQVGESMRPGESEYGRGVFAIETLASRLMDQIGYVDEVISLSDC